MLLCFVDVYFEAGKNDDSLPKARPKRSFTRRSNEDTETLRKNFGSYITDPKAGIPRKEDVLQFQQKFRKSGTIGW